MHRISIILRLLGPALASTTALAHPLAAQDDRWQISLDNDQYVWDIRLVRLDGDSLFVRQSDSVVGVPVAHIRELRLIRKSEVQLGGGDAGGAMSALTGADDEVYDLSPLEFAERIRTVQRILLMHPAAP
ncbi:MAG TPA: hypothetical protein VFP28_10520 [Gemmatimonadales bacterium]|nr:hypothetical protein [Gemmatimonadales bacterium]